MQSKAATVEQYLAALPADRRAAISAVRDVMLKNLDKNYHEGMQYGMIGYFVPHSVFPPGYHCDPKQPLPFAGLASQKNHMSLYLMCVYMHGESHTRFCQAWARTGKKLDMGKACIRFKKLDDMALDVIAETIRGIPASKYIEIYQNNLLGSAKASAGRSAAKKPAPKKTAPKPKADAKRTPTKVTKKKVAKKARAR
jgi:hypothetical protein